MGKGYWCLYVCGVREIDEFNTLIYGSAITDVGSAFDTLSYSDGVCAIGRERIRLDFRDDKEDSVIMVVTAHEIGHNFYVAKWVGDRHCHYPDCIMYPFFGRKSCWRIQGTNGEKGFGLCVKDATVRVS